MGLWVRRLHHFNETELSLLEAHEASLVGPNPLLVGLTLIHAASAEAVATLFGWNVTVPGYHLHRGHGSGANSWGGGWCNIVRSCVFRKTTRRGSSNFTEKELPFTGILSSNAEIQTAKLKFRGQRIWLAAMEDLMSVGMRHAKQALLSGCSAGGLVAIIIHCHEFHGDLYGGVVGLQGVQKNLQAFVPTTLIPLHVSSLRS